MLANTGNVCYKLGEMAPTALFRPFFTSRPGLPDGIFSNPRSPILRVFWRWKTFVYFRSIWYIGPNSKILGHLVNFVVIWYFSPFWYVVPRKIWQPYCRLLDFCVYVERLRSVPGLIVIKSAFETGFNWTRATRVARLDEISPFGKQLPKLI
jgi:hypothetical protein